MADSNIPLPAGGGRLSLQQMHDYIQQQGASPVADVGENPNDGLAHVALDNIGPGPSSTIVQKPEDDEDQEDTTPTQQLPQKSSLANIMALLKPKAQAPINLDVGSSSNDKGTLQAAQAAQQNAQLTGALGKAGELIGSGVAGLQGGGVIKPPTPQGTEQFNAIAKSGDTAIQQYQQHKDAEKEDPDSPLSKAFKQYAQKFGINVQGDFTAAMGEKLMPYAFKDFEANQLQNARNQTTGLKLLSMNEQKAETANAKNEKNQNDSYQKLRHDMETFRGNQAAQRASLDVLSADKALQLVQGKDPNTLTTQDLGLLTAELGKIASGGIPTEHGSTVLMPNNLQTKYAELKNFLLSKPTDAQAGAYISKNMEYLNRMKDVAHQTLSDYRTNIAKGYKNKVKSEDYKEAQNDYGLGEAAKKQASEKTVSSDQLAAYSKQHNVSPEEARSLLTKAGYNVQ